MKGTVMKIQQYFTHAHGVGVLSTSSGAGVVDSAIYARPHVLEDNSIGFIMRERLTHENVQENPHANYLFLEDGGEYKGVRLFLTKITPLYLIVCQSIALINGSGNLNTPSYTKSTLPALTRHCSC